MLATVTILIVLAQTSVDTTAAARQPDATLGLRWDIYKAAYDKTYADKEHELSSQPRNLLNTQPTCSLPAAKLSEKLCKHFDPNQMPLYRRLQLTGERKDTLRQWLIRDSAGHPGPSAPLDHSKANIFDHRDSLSLYLCKTFLTARQLKDQKCKFNKSTVGAIDTGYVDVKSGNETDLQLRVGSVGPVSCAVDASQISFQLYKSGIYNEKKCSTTPDHGALVVGYGTEGGKDFWIVKNSWGPKWGEQGYIRMSRNLGNQCGIATIASYPLV